MRLHLVRVVLWTDLLCYVNGGLVLEEDPTSIAITNDIWTLHGSDSAITSLAPALHAAAPDVVAPAF